MRDFARAGRLFVLSVVFVATPLALTVSCGGADHAAGPAGPIPVSTIVVSPPGGSLAVGTTLQLSATPLAASGTALPGRIVTWASGSDAIARVSSTGLVTAIAPGTTTITATSERKSGTATVTVTPVPVATVVVSLPTATIVAGQKTTLTATTYDASGSVLVGRVVQWTTSNEAVATVSVAGVVTGVAPGTATITATSEGKHGSVAVTVTAAADFVATGIKNIAAFLDVCPTSDPAYAQIRQDFELRLDGQVITTPVTCSGSISALPIAQFTDQLVALQVLRTAFYMSQGTEGKLPWTTKSLYAWMMSDIAGVNLKSAPGQLYCCDVINGKRYFSTSLQDDAQREFKRTWIGISGSLNFYAHEIRHADAGSPGHTTGCPAFPLPTDPSGCDATYDVTNLGSYGVQYWLESRWATGYLNIGIGCSAATAQSYAKWDESSANSFRSRFVANAPPVVTASPPYGGPCVP